MSITKPYLERKYRKKIDWIYYRERKHGKDVYEVHFRNGSTAKCYIDFFENKFEKIEDEAKAVSASS